MTTPRLRLVLVRSLLAAVALAGATACNVDAAGAVNCVDDSNCPSDYPVCGSDGKCAAGTVTAGGVSVSVAGVVGVDTTKPIRGSITVQVTAKSSTGISKVELEPGTGTAIPAGNQKGPLYTFTVDTTTLADGPLDFKAKVTPGSGAAVESPALSVTIDNTAPVVKGGDGTSAPALNQTTATVGTALWVDLVVTGETGAVALAGAVTKGTLSLPMSEVSSGTAGVRRMQYVVGPPTSTPTGSYTVSITATDVAGNKTTVADSTATPLHFGVTVQLTVAMDVTGHVSGGTKTKINGLPAATIGDGVNAVLTLPAGVTLASGFPKYKVLRPNSTTGTVTLNSDGSGTYVVPPGEIEGVFTFHADIEDTAGNDVPVEEPFLIQTTPPKVVGDATGVTLSSDFVGPNTSALVVGFTSDSTPLTKAVSVNGNGASQTSAAGNSVQFTYNLATDDLPSPAGVAQLPVVITLGDILGNTSHTNTSVAVDNLPPTLVAPTSSRAVASANTVVSLSFSVADTGEVGKNPTVLVKPNATGSGTPADFVSRTDHTGGSDFVYQYKVRNADDEGPATVVVTGFDAAANSTTTSYPAIFVIDRTAPAFTTTVSVDKKTQSVGHVVNVSTTIRDCNLANDPTIKFVDNTTGATVGSGTMTRGSGTIGCSTAITFTAAHTVGNSETNGGQITATITAIDDGDNGSTGSVSYTVDSSAPTVLSSAFTPQTNNTGSTSFSFVASKPLSGSTTVRVTPDNGATVIGNGGTFAQGGTITITPATTSTCTTCTYTMTGLATTAAQSSTWKAVISMVDTVGVPNTGTSTPATTFVADKTLPAISGSPTVSPSIARAGQIVQLTAISTKALSAVTVFTDNGDIASSNPQSCGFDSSNKVTCLITVADGSPASTANIKLNLTDSLGNVSTNLAAGSYTIDNVAPSVVNGYVGTTAGATTSTAYQFYKSGSTVFAGFDVKELHIGTGSPVTAKVSYISTTSSQLVVTPLTQVSTSGSCASTQGCHYVFSHTLASDEGDGAVTITAQALDVTGASGSLNITYTSDNTAPTVNLAGVFTPTTSYDGLGTLLVTPSEPLLTLGLKLKNKTTNFTYDSGQTQNGQTPVFALDATTPLPCSPCKFNLSGLRRASFVDDWTFVVASATDRASNSIAGAPLTGTSSLSVDGVHTAFILTTVAVAPLFVQSRGGSPAQITMVAQATAALSSTTSTSPTLALGGASGDSVPTCNVNSNNVTCVLTASTVEGLRSPLSGTINDTTGNSALWTAPTSTQYTVDNTAPAAGSITLTGGALVGGLRTYSAISGFNTVNVSVPITECDSGLSVTLTAVDASGATQSFSNGATPATNCSTPVTYTFSRVITSGDAEGVTRISVLMTDRAGNSSIATTSYVVDRTAPALANGGTPVFSRSIGNDGSALNLTVPLSEATTGSFSGSSALDFLVMKDGSSNTYTTGVTTNGIQATFAIGAGACSSCNFTITNLTKAASTQTFTPTLHVTDLVGNTATLTLTGVTYVNDTIAPDFPASGAGAATSSPAIVSNKAGFNSVVITATSTKAMQATGVKAPSISLNNSDTGTCVLDAATQKTITCTVTVSDAFSGAQKTVTATIAGSDLAGNAVTTHNTATYTVDNVAIATGAITVSPTLAAKTQTVTISGTATKTGVASFKLGSATIAAAGSPILNPICSVTGAAYTCSVQVNDSTSGSTVNAQPLLTLTDIAGNTISGNPSYTVDNRAATAGALTTPTTLPLLTVVGGTTAGLQLNWAAQGGGANCTVAGNCYITSSADPGKSKNVTDNNSGSYSTVASGSCTTNCLPHPSKSTVYTLTVTAVNGAVVTQSLSVPVAPQITTFAPVATPVTTVTSGTNANLNISLKGVDCTQATLCRIDGFGADGSSGNTVSLAGTGSFNSGTNTYTKPTHSVRAGLGLATYTLTATDTNGGTASTTTVVNAIAVPVIGTFSASPNITDGQSIVFNVAISGTDCATANSCVISNNQGVTATSFTSNNPGTVTVPAAAGFNSKTTQFTLTVKNAAADTAGTVQATFNVASAATPAAPTGATASPATITSGESGNFNISWTGGAPASGTSTISLTGGTTVLATLSGGSTSNATIPKSACTGSSCSFVISFCNLAGTCSTATTNSVTVVAPPNITSGTFSVSPSSITVGETGTFTFTAPTFTGTGSGTSTVSGLGIATSVPIASNGTATSGYAVGNASASAGTVTYTLTLKNSAGTPATLTQTAAVTVVAAPTASGTFSGPTAAVPGSTITINLPTPGGTASTMVLKAAGTAITGNLFGQSTTTISAPSATTVYTVDISNGLSGSNATITFPTTLTIHAADSLSSDIVTGNLFGAASAVISGGPNDGKILVTGGASTAATTTAATPAGSTATWVIDPATGTATAGAALATARAYHQMFALGGGKVLVLGGQGSTQATYEVYDNSTGSPTSAALGSSPTTRRCSFGVAGPFGTSNKILSIGGTDCANNGLDTWELVDPTSGAVVTNGGGNKLAAKRGYVQAVRLGATGTTSNQVLIAGGIDTASAKSSTEVWTYNSTETSCTTTNSVGLAGGNRFGYTATLFSTTSSACTGPTDCRVLIAGGGGGASGAPLTTAEVYTPNASPGSATTAATSGPMSAARQDFVSVLTGPFSTNSSLILMAGGWTTGGTALKSTEFFDTAQSKFFAGPSLSQGRRQFTIASAGTSYNLFAVGGSTTASSIVDDVTVTP